VCLEGTQIAVSFSVYHDGLPVHQQVDCAQAFAVQQQQQQQQQQALLAAATLVWAMGLQDVNTHVRAGTSFHWIFWIMLTANMTPSCCCIGVVVRTAAHHTGITKYSFIGFTSMVWAMWLKQ
jgi:hypothetical protein